MKKNISKEIQKVSKRNIEEEHLKKIHIKIHIEKNLLLSLLLTSSLYCDTDWEWNNLPTHITLTGGVRNDTVTPRKGNGQMTMIDLKSSVFTLTGTPKSQYILTILNSPQATPQSTTYYSGGFSIGKELSFTLESVHTLALETGKRIDVKENASFIINGTHTTINSAGSEYGGQSKFRFSSNTWKKQISSLNLSSGARAEFKNAFFFIHDGTITMQKDSTLAIQTDVIRFQRSLSNNGGEINLKGNTYIVGSPIDTKPAGTGQKNTAAFFTSIDGKVAIEGNLYNGGTTPIDSSQNPIFPAFDPPAMGGGSIVLKGGSMQVSGNIISQSGGSSSNEGGLQNSNIELYGSSLKAQNLQNQANSLLLFGAYDNKMGTFEGNIQNNGNVLVDLGGIKLDGDYQLVLGTISGITSDKIELKNGNTGFSKAILDFKNDEWSGVVKLQIDQNAINAFKQGLNEGERGILESFGDEIFIFEGATTSSLSQDVSTFKDKLKTGLLDSSYLFIETMKSHSTILDLRPHTLTFDILGGGIWGGGNGGIGGIGMRWDDETLFEIGSLEMSFWGAYAYGNFNQSLPSFNLLGISEFKNQSHNLALNAYTNFIFQESETSLSVGYFASFLASSRKTQTPDTFEILTSRYSHHYIRANLAQGYRFSFSQFFTKPYFSLNQALHLIPSFSEGDSSYAYSSQKYCTYDLSAMVGIEMGYEISNLYKIYANVSYEGMIYNSSDFVLFTSSHTPIAFKTPFIHRVGVDFGGYVGINEAFGVNFEGNFKYMGKDFYYLGGNIALKYTFSSF
ncbi:hypothetical protein [Helicobacter cholecystus]|nr:hypothetical protein [Helicobacter cholecystus]